MAECDVDHRSDNVLQDLVLVVESGPDVDTNEVDRMVRQLRAELRNLDVESIASVTSENAPRGAKGVEPFSLAALLITLTSTGGITAVIETARDLLARHAAAGRISVTINGDTIMLEKGSAQERSALIDAYIRRHEVE